MITAIDALLGHKPDLADKLGPVKIQLLMKLDRQERAWNSPGHSSEAPSAKSPEA